jgi:hypothetical protein
LISIDEMVANLVEDSTLKPLNNSDAALIAAKNLIFAILGWQTMLYLPDSRSCPPTHLAIADDMDGHSGQAHICLKQSHIACKRPMHEFLLGFGVLLPPANFNASESPEDKKLFNELKTASTTSFNAHLLTSVGGVNIKWIDTLPCHLEFDALSNTLFLFRYPSFCIANLPPRKAEHIRKSVIHACGAPYGTGQWATADETTQLLREILLSYRLLFGQNKASRHLFRKLRPFGQIAEEGRDKYLKLLCGQKSNQMGDEIPEREIYDLRRDFPILRSRLAILLRHMGDRKPRTWMELWVDKRDEASWLTFWAVLVIGGLGILLALMQVVLQIVQIVG